MVSYNTPIELIEQLKIKIGAYISTNSREWSGFGLNIDKMEFQNALHLIVAIEREYRLLPALVYISISTCFPCFTDRANWQDWGGRWTRRNAFMRFLKTVLEELDIRYTMPVQPILLPSSNGRPPMPPAQGTPAAPAPSPNPSLGNAGHFQAGGYGEIPGHTLSQGVSSFK
jgi:hypothetical protein